MTNKEMHNSIFCLLFSRKFLF